MAGRKKDNQDRLHFSPLSRTKKKRGEKVRLIGAGLAFCLIAGALVCCLVFINWGLGALLFNRNPHFTLEKIETFSDGVLNPQTIHSYLIECGVEEKVANLFSLDLKSIREKLKANHVLIKEVEFFRELPDTLRVRIWEPKPFVRLRKNLLLARDGMVLPSRQDGWIETLPLLTGFRNSADLKPGDIFDAPMVKSALNFIALTQTEETGEFISPALIQPDYSEKALKVYLTGNGPFRDQAQLIVPADPDKMMQALTRVHAIVLERYKVGQGIGFLDATYEKNVPVRP